MRYRRKPAHTFESLESRSMLAGNVTAAVDGGGNLTITGDAKANTIYIAETHNGGWQIQGLDTKINGHDKIIVTAPVTGGIVVNMGDGNDKFFMQDGTVAGDVAIDMGGGKNTAALWDLDIALLHFTAGDLNDTLWMDRVVVAQQGSSIDMQAGKDTVTINHFSAPDLQISLGAGNDSLTMQNSLVSGGTSPQLGIDAGSDRDNVRLSKVQADTLHIEMGSGIKDSLSISQSEFDVGDFLDTAGTKGSISGTGNRGIGGQPISSQTIDPNFTHHSGDFNHDIV